MEEKFVKETIIKEKNEEQRNEELVKSILITKKLLVQAHQNFEFAESGLIDYYSYNIKAYQTKLDFLIKQAKLKGLMMDIRMQKRMEEETEVS